VVGLILKDKFWAVIAVQEPGTCSRVLVIQSNSLDDYERELADARRFFNNHVLLSSYEEVSLF